MAKQLVNPVERHIEKLIVGVAALLLIAAVVRFGVTSPNKIELGGESVTPATIDERVAMKAASIRDRIRSAPVEVEQPEPLLDDFVAALSPLKPVLLPWVGPVYPEPPLIDRPETPIGRKELVKAVIPDAPELTSGRSTVERVSPAGITSYPVIDWVTVSSLFNVKQQADVQKLAYGAQYGDIVFGPFELQRRARRPDGTWSDDDWEDVTPTPAARPIPPPSVELVPQGDRLIVPRETQNAIADFYDRLSHPLHQLDLLRPLMYEIVNGTRWSFPILTTYEDVLKQDDYYLYPNQPPTQFPEDRYGLGERPAQAQSASREKTVAQQLDEIRQMMKAARDTCSPNMAVDAYNKAFDLARSKEASPADRQRAAQLQAEADQLSKDIERDLRRGLCKVAQVEGGAEGEFKRVPLAVQQFWLHDAADGSVKPGTTYQYRVRSKIFNQLAGDATKFANPEDATKIFVVSEWSEPSAPVTVSPEVEFWVTGEDERKEQVNIELFQWAEGVWVKDRFKFGLGDDIRAESRQKVPSFDDPTVPDNALIRFNASAVLVGLDFKRSFRERKRGKSREGFVIGPPEATCAALFVDGEGRLFERFVLEDKSDPGKRAAVLRVEHGEQIWRGSR